MSEAEKIQERFKAFRADIKQCVEKLTEGTEMQVIEIHLDSRDFYVELMGDGIRCKLGTIRRHFDETE